MQKHQIQLPQEDMERVDTLRYMWAKLQEQVTLLQTSLLEIQPKFRLTLITNVQHYHKEVNSYTNDYQTVSWQCFHKCMVSGDFGNSAGHATLKRKFSERAF